MTKRGNGEGTIRRRRDGRWEARIFGADGNRKSVYAKSRRDLVAMVRPLERDRELGLPTRSELVATKAFLEKWIEGTRANVRPTTALRYEGLIRRHLVPRLGRIPLTRLAPHDLSACYAAMIGDGLAPRTAGHAHRVLGRALHDAELGGLVGRNVARLVKAPRVPQQEMKSLDAAQAHLLLAAAVGDRLEALYLPAL